MKKRRINESDSGEPPDKKVQLSSPDIKAGTVLVDILGNTWKLGKSVGVGGFGEIYLATDDSSVNAEAPFVAKVESHTSGPLFVEIHCYLRIGKAEAIKQWKTENNMRHLAIPHYVTYGSHTVGDNKYRFLILPRYEKDLQAIFDIKRKFNLKTVLTIGLQIVDALEYLHNNGYVHSDIKASNILLNEYKKKPSGGKLLRKSPMRHCKGRKIQRGLRMPLHKGEPKLPVPSPKSIDEIFLLDYGLACKYITSNGEHKPFEHDSRKAHAGTILFCSRDAHKGVHSRRSDLECLGYNLIYWLTSDLPWSKTSDPEAVHKKKCRYMQNLKPFLEYAFNFEYPRFVYDYLTYLQTLDFEIKPNYGYIKGLFNNALVEHGYNNNLLLDFDNLEGWGRKQKKCNSETVRVKRAKMLLQRSPLKSSLPVRPNLRNFKLKQSLVSLLIDPEVIIKKARERKLTENSENSGIQNLDINALNPTSAMMGVFNKSMGISHGNNYWPRNCFGTLVEGYTPAMFDVYIRMKEREYVEYQNQLAEENAKIKVIKRRGRPPKNKAPQSQGRLINKNKPKVIPFKRTYSLRG